MTDKQAPGAPPPDTQADLAGLIRDWATVWGSELAALAVDREWLEWTGALAGGTGEPSGRAGSASPPGTAAAAAAPDARDAAARAEIERLGRRVAELERRLAELERGR